MKKEGNYYCFVAGHSGGHIIPCITLSERIVKEDASARILFFTTRATLDNTITQSLTQNCRVVSLPIVSFVRKNPLCLIKNLIGLVASVGISFYYLARYRPHSVTSTGGICSVPVAIVAYCLRIPIDLYELNVIPGKAIHFLAAVARTVYCCFDRTIDFLPRMLCKKTAYPIRYAQRSVPIQQRNLHKKTIFILGGSQGSLFINTMIKQWLEHEQTKDMFHIIHQTGSLDNTNWQLWYAHHKVTATVFDFHHALHNYYALADLIICRSGAGSLFEAVHYSIPCITIPLESAANGHQLHNAFTMAHIYPHLFTVLTQSTLKKHPDLLTQQIHTRVCTHTHEHLINRSSLQQDKFMP